MNSPDAAADPLRPDGWLFDNAAPDQPALAADHPASPPAAPRLRLPERQQAEFRYFSLDRTLPADHQARVVWDYVCQLDLSPLLGAIRAVAGAPGRDATDPRILMSLWLYATLEGVGSARHLDRLCQEHLAFMWIAGGVSVNHKLLADFRVQHE